MLVLRTLDPEIEVKGCCVKLSRYGTTLEINYEHQAPDEFRYVQIH